MRNPNRFSWLLLLFILLTGCTTRAPQYRVIGGVENLTQLENLHAVAKRTHAGKSQDLQLEAVREIGLSTGAQAGLAARAQEINRAREKASPQLDHIFNFNLLLLPHNVMPPVLIQSESSLNLTDTQTLRISDRTYQIVRQAHFVSVPPSWRDYLWLNYNQPEKPAAAFLPKTKAEREIWRRAVREGWKNGILQAQTIDAENLSRLQRDYTGMVRYRKLFKQGMVSEPHIAHTDLGITGDNDTLRIHDQVLRITALPALKTSPEDWKAILTRDG